MPQYYFHVQDGYRFTDKAGVELPTDGEARLQAVRVLAEILRDHPKEFWRDEGLELTVTDKRGLILFVINVVGRTSPAVRNVRAADRDQGV